MLPLRWQPGQEGFSVRSLPFGFRFAALPNVELTVAFVVLPEGFTKFAIEVLDRFLPTSEWTQMRDILAGDPDLSQTWEMVSHAYARVDAVNRSQTRLIQEEDEYTSVGVVIEDDETAEDPQGNPGFADLEEARAAVGRAERDLSNALRDL